MESPKRRRATPGKEHWYPYYAGFSMAFADDALRAASIGTMGRVLDPWNGSGTTTQAAYDLGYQAVGYDLNPVMVLIAKARLLGSEVGQSLLPIAHELTRKAEVIGIPSVDDPLCKWFRPENASHIRAIELAVRSTLTAQAHPLGTDQFQADEVSSLAAFYYVALFRTLRELIAGFRCTNPVWIKTPSSERHRLRPSKQAVVSAFKGHVETMATAGLAPPLSTRRRLGTTRLPKILVGNASRLPETTESFDAVVTSPPYLTRIDYAVSTLPELALLGHSEEQVRTIRQLMLGSPLVPSIVPSLSADWGSACTAILESVRTHPSKASATYYYKTVAAYFSQLFDSLSEINRILKPHGTCVVVVQDSHYKELHLDLPLVTQQMASRLSWHTQNHASFPATSLLARSNPRSLKYRQATFATETVFTFHKTA